MRDRVELVAEVHAVGRDDHAAGGDLVAHLLGGQVRLALGDAPHLGRHDAEPRVLELRSSGTKPAALREAVRSASNPGQEVPRRLVARRGHARRVGRRERRAARRRRRGSRTSPGSCPRRATRDSSRHGAAESKLASVSSFLDSLARGEENAVARRASHPYAGPNRIRSCGSVSAASVEAAPRATFDLVVSVAGVRNPISRNDAETPSQRGLDDWGLGWRRDQRVVLEGATPRLAVVRSPMLKYLAYPSGNTVTTVAIARREPLGGHEVGAGRDADAIAVHLGESLRGLASLRRRDANDLVDQRVQAPRAVAGNGRDESVTDSANAVGARARRS